VSDVATQFEQDEDGSSVLVEVSGLGVSERASIDKQIATAKEYPRNVQLALKQAREFALFDEETAASMFYAMPRADKVIEGPSIRLAEILAYCWGNLRADDGVESVGEKTVTTYSTVFDLEKNFAFRSRNERRITNNKGKRYGDDMIITTANASKSIAYRNAVLKVIPAAYWKPIYEAARVKSVGTIESLGKMFKGAADWFAKLAITEPQLLERLGRESVKDITMDDIITLRGLRTAILEKEITIEEAFRREDDGPRQSPGAQRMNESGEDEPPITGSTAGDPHTETAYLAAPANKKFGSSHQRFVEMLLSNFDDVPHATRQAWMQKLTGKTSTKDFTLADFNICTDAIEDGRGPSVA
jgi:hypothetical protein